LLFRLARNLALDRIRRQGVREAYKQGVQGTSQSNVIAFEPPRTPEDLLLEKELQQCASQARARLSPKEQECLELRSSGLSYRDVASALGLNPNTIGSLMARALRHFGQAMESACLRASAVGLKRYRGNRRCRAGQWPQALD